MISISDTIKRNDDEMKLLKDRNCKCPVELPDDQPSVATGDASSNADHKIFIMWKCEDV